MIITRRQCKPSSKVTYKRSLVIEFCSYCGSLMVDMIKEDESTLVCNSEQCTSSFVRRSRSTQNKGGSE
jgi:hypothetical protein